MTNMVADFFLPRAKDELPPFLSVTSYPALSSFLTDPANSTVDQLMQLRPKCLFDAQNRVLLSCNTRHDTIRYDTRCYFNVRSKADISQLNLPHGTDN